MMYEPDASSLNWTSQSRPHISRSARGADLRDRREQARPSQARRMERPRLQRHRRRDRHRDQFSACRSLQQWWDPTLSVLTSQCARDDARPLFAFVKRKRKCPVGWRSSRRLASESFIPSRVSWASTSPPRHSESFCWDQGQVGRRSQCSR